MIRTAAAIAIVCAVLSVAAAAIALTNRTPDPPAAPTSTLSASCAEALTAADQLAIGAGQLSDGLNGARYSNTATEANYLRQLGQISDRYRSARVGCP